MNLVLLAQMTRSLCIRSLQQLKQVLIGGYVDLARRIAVGIECWCVTLESFDSFNGTCDFDIAVVFDDQNLASPSWK
jgi:hypothetical protein